MSKKNYVFRMLDKHMVNSEAAEYIKHYIENLISEANKNNKSKS